MKVTYERYPDLPKFLKTFVEYAATTLQARSIILTGDIVLDDFSNRYSTIDIIVILEKNLWDKDYDTIDEFVNRLVVVNKEYTHISRIFFLPYALLSNPRVIHEDIEGMIVHKLHQEIISKYPLVQSEDYLIREKGYVLYGEDIRQHFPIPPIDGFWHQFLEQFSLLEKGARSYPFQHTDIPDYDKAVNWILDFSQILYSLKNNDIIGKMKSAYWFTNEHPGRMGDFVVEVANCRKRNISLSSILEVVTRSRELMLFTLERVFRIKGIHIAKLRDLLKIEDETANFSRVFMEVRNIIENLR
ncbi:MAG: hypothetical protein KGD64_06800 [Candidatus Heimdallarchaeota archaeon]|nr:hypothetical protein [Candidatus Heimdallarchaeota archaeon]